MKWMRIGTGIEMMMRMRVMRAKICVEIIGWSDGDDINDDGENLVSLPHSRHLTTLSFILMRNLEIPERRYFTLI